MGIWGVEIVKLVDRAKVEAQCVANEFREPVGTATTYMGSAGTPDIWKEQGWYYIGPQTPTMHHCASFHALYPVASNESPLRLSRISVTGSYITSVALI